MIRAEVLTLGTVLSGVIAVAVTAFIVWALRNGRTFAGGGVQRREERPVAYWLAIAVTIGFAAVCWIVAIGGVLTGGR